MISYTQDDETWLRAFGSRTYAQHGEDILFAVIFDRLGIDRPAYIDVGAFHPTSLSNTALLYERGSRGINVEANPHLIPLFLKQRPEDLTLCCAIGPERLKGKRFYLAENPGLSSFDRAIIYGSVVEEIIAPVWTIPDILIGHRDGKWPELLSIDIEGDDLKTLEQCLPAEGDRPVVVCVEAIPAGVDKSAETRKLMTERNYFHFAWARANMIWVNEESRAALL